MLLLPSCLLSNQSSMIAERQCTYEGIYPIFVNNDNPKFSIIKKGNDYYLEGRIVTYKLMPPRYKKSSYFYKRGAKDQVVQYSQELRYYKIDRNAAVRFLKIYETADIPLQWRDENLFKEVLYNYHYHPIEPTHRRLYGMVMILNYNRVGGLSPPSHTTVRAIYGIRRFLGVLLVPKLLASAATLCYSPRPIHCQLLRSVTWVGLALSPSFGRGLSHFRDSWFCCYMFRDLSVCPRRIQPFPPGLFGLAVLWPLLTPYRRIDPQRFRA